MRHNFCDENNLFLFSIDPRCEIFDDVLVVYILEKFDFSFYPLSFVCWNPIYLDDVPSNFTAFMCIVGSPAKKKYLNETDTKQLQICPERTHLCRPQIQDDPQAKVQNRDKQNLGRRLGKHEL